MEVNLKSNGWYNRLQAWTLGDAKPDLFSLCPFFWLTIFCMVISPFTLIVKFFKWIIKGWDNKIQSKIDKWLDKMDIEDVISLYNDKAFKNKPFTRKKITPYQMFKRWKEVMRQKGMTAEEIDIYYANAYDEWERKSRERATTAREENRKNEERRQLAEEKEYAKQQKRKKAWIPIVMWTKRIVNLAITVVIMSVITLLINACIANFDATYALGTLIILGYVLAGIAAAVLIGFGIYFYAQWCKENERTPLVFRPFVWMAPYLGRFFDSIGRGIGNGFGLFWEYFKANKNDYCPAINWDVEKETKEN